eukprot:Clim_evm28s198 gene=Clim_evmTU28s198
MTIYHGESSDFRRDFNALYEYGVAMHDCGAGNLDHVINRCVMAVSPPDFSYAGYHNSERPVPRGTQGQTGRMINVLEHGLTNDGLNDNSAALQNLLDNVVQSGDTIYFPDGYYVLETAVVFEAWKRNLSSVRFQGNDKRQSVIVSRVKEDRIDGAAIVVEGCEKFGGGVLATVCGDQYNAGTHAVNVSMCPKQKVPKPGDVIFVRWNLRRSGFAKVFGRPALPINPEGYGTQENELINAILTVERVEGDTWYFKEPIPFRMLGNDVHKELEPVELRRLSKPVAQEISFERIGFTTAWRDYPEHFHHHKDATHDYGWGCIRMNGCRNGWIRDCGFWDCNMGVYLSRCSLMTLIDNEIGGKLGHFSITMNTCSFILSAFNTCTSDYWHGLTSCDGRVTGCVWIGNTGVSDQRTDFHTRALCMSLIDNQTGGTLFGSGGSKKGYPHHWSSLWVWNMKHVATKKMFYDFWPDTFKCRPQSMFAEIHVVGLDSNHPVTADNATSWSEEWVHEVPSLFMAQLHRRLHGMNSGSAQYVAGAVPAKAANGHNLTVPPQVPKRPTTNGNASPEVPARPTANGKASPEVPQRPERPPQRPQRKDKSKVNVEEGLHEASRFAKMSLGRSRGLISKMAK